MDTEAADRLRALTPEEARIELVRLATIIWGAETLPRQVEALRDSLDVSDNTARNWLKGATTPPLAVMLLLTIWAGGAKEAAHERHWCRVVEGLSGVADALKQIAAQK